MSTTTETGGPGSGTPETEQPASATGRPAEPTGRTAGSLGAMISAELTKLLRRPATWVLLGLWPALQLVFSTVIPYVSYQRGASFEGLPPEAVLASMLPDQLVLNSLSGLPLFGGALLLTLGALLAGSEYGWGTLKTLLGQGPRRLQVLAAQLLALLVVLAVTVLVSFGLTALASGAIAAGESAAADWPTAGRLLRGLGGGLLIAATWGALGLLLGHALRSTALPIALGLVWVLAAENLIVNVAAPLLGAFDTAQAALPGVNAGSLVAALAGNGATLRTPGVAAIVDGAQAAGVLAGFLVLFTALTALLLTRRDVV
ncbi:MULTISPECIES: ABC transporter permease subunit [unclassified Modestobacter]|uniref:ABC transporter permease subunit n=1 Tax=unclassified Modestobacter TaxID=2643866 RepID=UPI0022AA6B4F|nr:MULTISPECIES: ABC transporter permease subunit [unclassified Modestobacter]MCZ2822842.1 ABC transporter permease subunit [Modestobacter sp. VKM Ac-2981]MCZ2851088.1 ABC transporter permease subunit [Modestobacter sp. VKM Ac-2982]